MSFSIAGLTNPETTQPTDSLAIRILDASGFEINHYADSIQLVTTEAADFTSVSLSTSSLVPNEIMNSTFTVKLSHAVPSAGTFYVYYPSQIVLDEPSLSCKKSESAVACSLASLSE